MFSNCPYCGFLVALDESGRPLSRCPNCAQRLREDDAPTKPVAIEPGDGGTGKPTSDAAGHAAEPGDPRAAPNPGATLGLPPSGADAALAHATRTTGTPVASPHVAEVIGPVSPPPAAAIPASTANAAPSTRADGAPHAFPLQAHADTTPAATPAVPPSVVRTTVGEQASTAVGAGRVEVDGAPLRPAPGAPLSDADLVPSSPPADAPPAAADARHARPPAPDETGGAPPPASVVDTAPQTGGEPMPDMPPAAATDDESIQGSAADAAMGTAAATSATGPSATPAPAEITPAVREHEGDAFPMPSAGGPADPGQEADLAPPLAVPASVGAQADDATALGLPGTPSRPSRRKPGAPAAPSFARVSAGVVATDRRRLALRWGAIAVLSLLLVLQLLLSDRARLARDAHWRPLLTQVCGVLQCTLPAWREPQAFRVIERDITQRAPGVLRVSARIRNDARWAQPWPSLQLTLSDANGRDVATRLFTPREYLGGAPAQSELGSGQSAALSMDIVEPGPQAVAFTFDFR